MQSTSFQAEALQSLPRVTADQMHRIIAKAVQVSEIPIHQMMERAGFAVNKIARCYSSKIFPRVAVLAGPGFTGSMAISTARCMANAGAQIQLILTLPEANLSAESAQQLKILKGWYPEIPIHDMSKISANNLPPMPDCDLIIDGLLGHGIQDAPRDPIAILISIANDAEVPTISIDIPSGVHPDTGGPCSLALKATATVTFTLPKEGFTRASAKPYLGELYLVNIGVCPKIIESVLTSDPFPRNLPEILYLYDEMIRE
ncbi:MAG TPA: NAD(P)H-hydrate epimerase [bacterium]|nr:NAD(P)H-hydrate epimerase [bacterium]